MAPYPEASPTEPHLDHPQPLVTVDAVLLTLCATGLEIALQPRGREPFKGAMALPGGVVHVDEDATTEASIRRVLRDKTGFCLLYTSPSPRDRQKSRMPSSA